MLTLKGNIVTLDDVQKASILVDDGRITEVTDTPSGSGKVFDFGNSLVLPGFIDMHTHGIGKYGMLTVDDLVGSAKMEPSFGVTSFLPTVASLTEQGYLQFAENIRQAKAGTDNTYAKIIGGHFEGPFINPKRKGGMDSEYLRTMDIDECQRYIDHAKDVFKLMTLSPELKGSEQVIKLLRKNNIVVSLGHSAATPEDLKQALSQIS